VLYFLRSTTLSYMTTLELTTLEVTTLKCVAAQPIRAHRTSMAGNTFHAQRKSVLSPANIIPLNSANTSVQSSHHDQSASIG